MSESSSLRGAVAGPALTDYGVRTELRLLGTDGDRARYEARWFFGSKATAAGQGAGGHSSQPDAHGLVAIDGKGDVSIDVQAGELPEWARTFTDKLLRTTTRGVQGGRYPRRLTRWRDGPT